MHHLALFACQVINQQPTLLIQGPVLTSAPSHSMATRWRLSTRPMGQKTIQTPSVHPVAPGRTSVQLHKSPWFVFQNTSAITQRIHKGADQFLTRVILPQQALFPCLLLLLCTASLFLSVIFFENMTLERMRHYLQICGHDYSYQKEKKGKSDNSRLCCKVIGMCCTWAIWISFFFSVDLKFCNNCYRVYLCTRQKKFSCSHGKKVILVNNTRAFHDWQTSTHTPWEVVEVLYISNSTHTHKKRKENAAGMDELHQLPRLRVKMMWFLDWTEKTFQYLARRCQNCHATAKCSLRDQTFSLIRLPEGYVSLNSNIKSSNMTSFIIIITHFRRSGATCSFGSE